MEVSEQNSQTQTIYTSTLIKILTNIYNKYDTSIVYIMRNVHPLYYHITNNKLIVYYKSLDLCVHDLKKLQNNIGF